MKFFRFLINVSVYTLIWALVIFLLDNLLGAVDFGVVIWYALLFFALLTVMVYSMASNALNKTNQTFITNVFGTMGIRVILSIFFLVIYLIFTPKTNVSFVIGFLLLYLFYTIFEIYYLVIKLRAEKKNEQDADNP